MINISEYFQDINKLFSTIPTGNIIELANRISLAKYDDSIVYVAGNGGSAATASHIVCDLTKLKHGSAKTINMTDNIPLMTAIANDISYNDIFSYQLENADYLDMLLVISCSGKSPNIIKAVKKGHDRGMDVYALLGTDGGEVGKLLPANRRIIIESNNYGVVEGMHDIIMHLVKDIIN